MRISKGVLIGATVATFALGWLQKMPCHSAGWPYQRDLIFGQRCYSDLPVMFTARGLAEGIFPYAAGSGLEYPVISGLVMDLTARLTRVLAVGGPDANRTFVELTALLLLGCAIVTVLATAATRGEPLDGLLVALAPVLALTGIINWDLIAVALSSLAILAWTRERPVLAGALIGLGTAAKLYPVLLLWPIVLLAIRTRQWRPAAQATGAAVAAWLVVNLPVAIAYPHGWGEFWRFNAERGADFGSAWYALEQLGHPVEPLNPIAIGLFAVLCLAIGGLALRAPRPPPLAALAFLTVAAFVVTNKVYSPQYVLWLLPLAALARPSIVELLLWQAAEVLYWFAVWHYLATGDQAYYPAATFLRIAATLWLMLRIAQCTWSLRHVAPSDEYATQPSATTSKAT